MTLWKSEHGFAYGLPLHVPRRRLDFPILVALAAAASLLAVGLVPPPLVLPALSIVSLVLTVIFVAWAWRRRADHRACGATLWHVAALFAAIWIGSGVLTTPEQVVQLFDHIATAR